MAYQFKQNLVPSSKYSIKCPYTMTPEYITVHNTSNNASAANEVKYMISKNNQTSYHVAVDEKEVVQTAKVEEKAGSDSFTVLKIMGIIVGLLLVLLFGRNHVRTVNNTNPIIHPAPLVP
ncbi:MAG: hypothetical protein UHI85_08085, partial [Turicibacter sp.]|nr:hypothetical protein [Turicibacter sp.]